MSSWLVSFMKTMRKAEHFAMRMENPTYDQFKLASKMPTNPNIVVLGAQSKKDQELVANYFQGHRIVNAAELLTEKSDMSASKRVAKELVEEYMFNGKVLVDFPRSIEEAAELDMYLEGVNLAIHFQGMTLNQQQKDIAAFYQQRGLLMTHVIDKSTSQNTQLEAFNDQLLASIKL